MLANAKPSVVDHYSVLGLSSDADMKTIKKVFREQAIELHPDKVTSACLYVCVCVCVTYVRICVET